MSQVCQDNATQLIDLLGCLAQKMGAETASYVNTKIEEITSIHDVDLEQLANQITIINNELDADDTALQGILDAITALQTSVSNNQTSITNVQNTVNTAITNLQNSIATEQSRVNSELARIEALIPTVHVPYDDTAIRGLIQANLEAIGSESATRVSEIARLEGLITSNTTSITQLQTSVAENTTRISTLRTDVDALIATVAANAAAINARVDSVELCMDSFFNTLNAASCETIAGYFTAGLNAGGSSEQGL